MIHNLPMESGTLALNSRHCSSHCLMTLLLLFLVGLWRSVGKETDQGGCAGRSSPAGYGSFCISAPVNSSQSMGRGCPALEDLQRESEGSTQRRRQVPCLACYVCVCATQEGEEFQLLSGGLWKRACRCVAWKGRIVVGADGTSSAVSPADAESGL